MSDERGGRTSWEGRSALGSRPRRGWLGRRCAALLGCALLLAPERAWAHPDRSLAPHDLWGAWSGEPGVLLGIGLSVWLYERGRRRLWARAGVGRGVRRWQVGCYRVGMVAVVVALVSPLDAMGGVLFSAHMAQHEILILLAAPLLVLGAPLVPFLWALPRSWRSRVGRWARRPALRVPWRLLTQPAVAWTVHATALAVWHVPAAFEATLTSEAAHVAQHASFFGSALLFWWPLVPHGGRGWMSRGVGALYLFAMGVFGAALGALLTFAPTVWYPAYGATVGAWGLTPLEDQQLGGLIMWVPGGIAHLVALVAYVAAWLQTMDAPRLALGSRGGGG